MPTKLNIHLQHGGLYGWCAHCSPKARHVALRKGVAAEGYGTIERRINVLTIYNEHRPGVERVAKRDKRWLEREHALDEQSARSFSRNWP